MSKLPKEYVSFERFPKEYRDKCKPICDHPYERTHRVGGVTCCKKCKKKIENDELGRR